MSLMSNTRQISTAYVAQQDRSAPLQKGSSPTCIGILCCDSNCYEMATTGMQALVDVPNDLPPSVPTQAYCYTSGA